MAKKVTFTPASTDTMPDQTSGRLGTTAHVWPVQAAPPGGPWEEVTTGPDANGQYTTEFCPIAPPNTADVLNAVADLSALVARLAPTTDAPATTMTAMYVTLDQMAAVVKKSKRTLQNYIKHERNPLPAPDKKRAPGTAHEWLWDRVRPWLQDEFACTLPTVFPADRGNG